MIDAVSTPMLLNTLRARKIDPKLLITHRFKLGQMLEAYETFGHAAKDPCAQGDYRSVAGGGAGPLKLPDSESDKD